MLLQQQINRLENPEYFTTNITGGNIGNGTYIQVMQNKTNSVMYMFNSYSIAPFYYGYQFSEDLIQTSLTFSGFGTFTGAPTLLWFQGSHSGDYYIYCEAAGGSASFTVGNIYSVTISGTTVTLGAAITPPTVASYSVSRVFVKGSTIYVVYQLTASPFTLGEVRKYTGSWTALTGAGIPTTNIPGIGGSTNKATMYQRIPVGTNADTFYLDTDYSNGAGWGQCIKFNTTTEIWSLYSSGQRGIVGDVDGYATGVCMMMNPSGEITGHSRNDLITSVTPGVMNIKKGLIVPYNSTGAFRIAGAKQLVNKKITRLVTAVSTYGIIYSSDGINYNLVPLNNVVTDFMNIDVKNGFVVLLSLNNGPGGVIEYM